MKKKLFISVIAMFLFALLAVFPAAAEETAYTADDILAYKGLAARTIGDDPGIRSLYTVNKKAVAYFENQGYTVAYGAVMAVARNGETVYFNSARNLTVTLSEGVFVQNHGAVITMYNDGKVYGTYNANGTDYADFSYTTIFNGKKYMTADFLTGAELCYAGFTALTKDGVTEIYYDYAEGERFGREDAVYGVATSLGELSDYFLNVYRDTEFSEKSRYAEVSLLRRVVSIVGINVTNDEIQYINNEKTTIGGTDGLTEKTFVIEGTGSQNGISFSVNNARRGYYSVQLRATNNALETSDVVISVNGRLYTQRILKNQTLESDNLAVSKSDGFRDTMKFHVLLDEGKNDIQMYVANGTNKNPIGIHALRFLMEAEIGEKDVLLSGVTALDTALTDTANEGFGDFYKENSTTLGGENVKTAFTRGKDLYYKLSVPAGGYYRVVSLAVSGNVGSTLTTSFLQNGTVVQKTALPITAGMSNGSSLAHQYYDCGVVALDRGDYTLKMTNGGNLAVSSIALIRENAEEQQPVTTFDIKAASGLLSDGTAVGTLSDGYTVFLSKNQTLSFSVDIEAPGLYLLQGKYNTNGGKIQYIYLKSDKQTAHALESRLNPNGTNTTYNTNEDFLVNDRSTEFVLDPDAMGYVYLTKGTHKLTFSHSGNGIDGLGLGNLRLSLVTDLTNGVYISAEKSTATVTGGGNVTQYYASRILDTRNEGAVIAFDFTPSDSGIYNALMPLISRTGHVIGFKVYEKASPENVVCDKEVTIPDPKDIGFSSGRTGGIYGLGCSSSPIETAMAENISLSGSTEYTVEVKLVTGSLLAFTDIHFSLQKKIFSTENVEKYKPDFTNGAIKSNATVDENVENMFVSKPILVKKAGTTLYFQASGARLGYADGTTFAVAVCEPTKAGYIIDGEATSAWNIRGDSGTKTGGGNIAYTITTKTDNTVLILSAKASEAAGLYVSYTGDAGNVETADIRNVDFDSATLAASAVFGSSEAASVTVTAQGKNGTIYALLYDKGDALIGVKTAEKTKYGQSFIFTCDDITGTVASVRVFMVSDTSSLSMITDTLLLRADGEKVLPRAVFTVTKAYLSHVGGDENAFVVHASDMATKGDVTTLINGEKLLTKGSTNYITFNVNAPVAGFYKIDMKYERRNGYIQYFRGYNLSYTPWSGKGNAESRFGDYDNAQDAEAETDEDYAISDAARYGVFDGIGEMYIYLTTGENELKFFFISDKNTKMAIDSMRFSLVVGYAVDKDTILMPVGGIASPVGEYKNTIVGGSLNYNQNGWFLRGGSTVYFSLSVPTDGKYSLSALGCASGATVRLTSTESSFLPIAATLDGTLGTSTSTIPFTLGTLNLKAGTYTVALDVTGSYFHANMFMLKKIADYDKNGTFLVERTGFDVNTKDGSFTLTYKVIGKAPSGNLGLKETVSVEGVETVNNTATPFQYTLTSIRDAYETNYTFTGAARTGFKSMTLVYRLYDGDTVVYESAPYSCVSHYDDLDGLTVVVIGDSYFDDPTVQPNMWIDLLKQEYNLTLYNHAYSGSTVSNSKELISNTAHSGYGKETIAQNPMCERFDDGAPRQMPKCEPDIVLFDAGRNDFWRGAALGTLYLEGTTELNMDTTTFYGAVNYTIAKLREFYPNAIIITFTCYNHAETNSATGHTQVEFGEAMLAASEANGITCFSNLDESVTGVHMDDHAFRAEYCKTATDISHLNAKGMAMVYPTMVKFVAETYRANAPTRISSSKAVFGDSTVAAVSATYSGMENGIALALAYDKGESLIGISEQEKTQYSQEMQFTFPEMTGSAASFRLLLLKDKRDYENLVRPRILTPTGVQILSINAFTVSHDYLAAIGGDENAFVVHASDMATKGDVTTLINGEKLLTKGSTNYITFNVNAPVAGFYKIDMKYERRNGYIQYFRGYNLSYTPWSGKGNAESRFGDYDNAQDAEAETDEDYAISDAARYGVFDGIGEMYIYLTTGENELKFFFISDKNTKMAIDSMRFSLVVGYAVDKDTILMPVGGIASPVGEYKNTIVGGSLNYNQNGWFLRGGSTVYFSLTVPEDGQYVLKMLGCGYVATVSLKSMDEEFLPMHAYVNDTVGVSTSTMPFTLGTLNLKAGTYTVALDVTGSYFHANMFMLDKVAEYDSENFCCVTRDNFEIDFDTGDYSLSYNVVGKLTNGNYMTERLTVSGEDASGTFSETFENVRTAFETANLFTGTRVGLKSMTLTYQLLDGDRVIYAAEPLVYRRNQLNVMFVSDIHYTGTELSQEIYWSLKDATQEKNTLREFNYATWQCENYGQISDRKLQRLVDEIVKKYENGELDIVFILGDASNNESCYEQFQTENVRYQKKLNNNQTNLASSMDEFWDSPLNVNYLLKKLFLEQLSKKGIPYFLANGNHDYSYSYNKEKTDLDYTPWEDLFHYAELFGHKTEADNGSYLHDENGNYVHYEDSDSVHYLVRIIRREGKVKILSSLSETDLEIFKETHKDDGNCYDFYVSEDSVTENDELVAAFVMVNGFRFDTFDYYTKVGVVDGNYSGQTVRYEKIREDFTENMLERSKDYKNVYLLGHLVSSVDVLELIDKYENIKAIFSGDVHNEEVNAVGPIKNFVDGQNVTVFDLDYYYQEDGTADNQYYYCRGGTNSYGNRVWSDFMRHPNSYAMMEICGETVSLFQRVHYSGFYENGLMTVSSGRLAGSDIRYARAVADASRFAAGEHLYVIEKDGKSLLLRKDDLDSYGFTENSSGVRKVYVGGDVVNAGTSYRNLCLSYEKGKYNTPSYRIDLSGNVYDLSGVPLGKTVTPSDYNEGTSVSIDGVNYYICGKSGGVYGHYLYDEKGDYVFLDKNDNLVFYAAREKDANYVEASIQEEMSIQNKKQIMYSGPYQRCWYYENSEFGFVDIPVDENGKLVDGTYTDLYVTDADTTQKRYGDFHAVSGVYTPEIVVRNGKIVKGEGWCRFSYIADYTYADGTVVDKEKLKIDYDANGNIVYGIYIPETIFAEQSIVR